MQNAGSVWHPFLFRWRNPNGDSCLIKGDSKKMEKFHTHKNLLNNITFIFSNPSESSSKKIEKKLNTPGVTGVRIRHPFSGIFQGPLTQRNSHSTSHFRIPRDMGMVWVPLTIRRGSPMSLGVPGKSPPLESMEIPMTILGDPCKVSGKEGTFQCGTWLASRWWSRDRFCIPEFGGVEQKRCLFSNNCLCLHTSRKWK